MNKRMGAAILPLALLLGCGSQLGSQMVWRGPPGTAQQELDEARRECLQRSSAWRAQNAPEYAENPADIAATGTQWRSDQMYRVSDQIFQRCMTAKGYALVARSQ